MSTGCGKDIQNKTFNSDLIFSEEITDAIYDIVETGLEGIFSGDEEDSLIEGSFEVMDSNEKQCSNTGNDDIRSTEPSQTKNTSKKEEDPITATDETDSGTSGKSIKQTHDLLAKNEQKESIPPAVSNNTSSEINNEKQENKFEKNKQELPLLSDTFLESAKKNIANMTREELEEFCAQKIAEIISNKINLKFIKNKLISMHQDSMVYMKKTMILAKQHHDLHIILQSIQDQQKKQLPVTPFKITRSVGLQVFLKNTNDQRKNLPQLLNLNNNNVANRQIVNNASSTQRRSQNQTLQGANNHPIPAPGLVPANSPGIKIPSTTHLVNQITPSKTPSSMINTKNILPSQKGAEKRPHDIIKSEIIDLTDDEPPVKMNNRISPAPQIGLVSIEKLMASTRPQVASNVSSLRNVYIPINITQSQNIRPGSTIKLNTAVAPTLKQESPTSLVAIIPPNAVKMESSQTGRHPALLLGTMKSLQSPNLKPLPPPPLLKLSNPGNKLFVSWIIEGYQEDRYEKIASYVIYEYHDTSPPQGEMSWRKVGQVQALPLPMTCELINYNVGLKYHIAVVAVDIRSRIGPMSLPASILLKNN